MSKSILLLAAMSAAFASDGGVGGPITGFVLDGRANALRAIEGLPGAARLGAPVRLPFAIALAAIASRHDFALVSPASDGAGALVLARGLRSGAPDVVSIDSAIHPSAIVLAGSGAAAVLYSAAARRLQFLDGLPAGPRALAPIDTSAVDVVAVALDPGGMVALLAAADGRIWRATPSSALLEPIARLDGVSSLSFLPGRDAVLAAVASAGDDPGKILLLEGLAGALSIRTVAAIPGARSVQALDAGAAGVITADGRLGALDLETSGVEWIPLASEAEAFDALDRSLFVLNRAGDRPLLLLDAARGRSAWFVPPEPPRPGITRRIANRGEDRP